jgi:hypothetical protein
MAVAAPSAVKYSGGEKQLRRGGGGMGGVILLVFLALIVAYIWRKIGGRAGFKVSNRTLMGVIAVFILLVALLYASSQGH